MTKKSVAGTYRMCSILLAFWLLCNALPVFGAAVSWVQNQDFSAGVLPGGYFVRNESAQTVSADFSSGFGGKKQENSVFAITADNATGIEANGIYLQYAPLQAFSFSSTYTFEVSVYNGANATAQVMIRTSSGYHQMYNHYKGGQVQCKGTSLGNYAKGAWHRVAIEFDPIEDAAQVYINGVLCATEDMQISGSTINYIQIKMLADGEAVSGTIALDDLKVYQGTYEPEGDLVSPRTESDFIEVQDGKIKLSGNKINSLSTLLRELGADEAKAVLYAGADMAQETEDVSHGAVLVLTSESGAAYGYYTIHLAFRMTELIWNDSGGKLGARAVFINEEAPKSITMIMVIKDSAGAVTRTLASQTVLAGEDEPVIDPVDLLGATAEIFFIDDLTLRVPYSAATHKYEN